MVTKWGFSTKLGIQFIDDKEKYSGETQTIVDTEVRQLLSDSYSRAKTMLETHRKKLNLIAEALIEHETLSGSEIADIAKGKKLDLRNRSQKPSREAKVLPPSKKGSHTSAGGKKATDAASKRPAPAVVQKTSKSSEDNKASAAAVSSTAKKPSATTTASGGAVRGPPTSSSSTSSESSAGGNSANK